MTPEEQAFIEKFKARTPEERARKRAQFEASWQASQEKRKAREASLVESAAPATPPLDTHLKEEGPKGSDEQSRDELLDLGDPLTFTPVRYYIDRLLPQGFTVWSGYTGVGKTTAALNTLDAAGHGTDFLGYSATGKYRCLYILLERGPEWAGEYINLVWPAGEAQRPKGSKLSITRKWKTTTYTPKDGEKLSGPMAWIVKNIEQHQFDVIFIDNLDELKRHCHKTVTNLYHELDELSVKYRIAIVGLTAADKATKKGPKAKSEDVGTATRKINMRMRGDNAAEVTVEGSGLARPERFIALRDQGRWIRREWTPEETQSVSHTQERLTRDQKLMLLRGLAATLSRKPTSTEAVKELGLTSTTAKRLLKML